MAFDWVFFSVLRRQDWLCIHKMKPAHGSNGNREAKNPTYPDGQTSRHDTINQQGVQKNITLSAVWTWSTFDVVQPLWVLWCGCLVVKLSNRLLGEAPFLYMVTLHNFDFDWNFRKIAKVLDQQLPRIVILCKGCTSCKLSY